MDDSYDIAFGSGEFRRPRLETRFREDQSRTELRQLSLLWTAALCCFALYLPVEALSRGGVLDWALLWPRLGILLLGATVLLLLRSPRLRPRRDWISSAGLLLAMLCYSSLLEARGQQSSGALLLLILGSYLFSPCRFALHCATGVLGSAGAVWIAGGVVPWLEFSYLLPANLLAALALAQLNRSRRRLYRQGRQLAAEVGRRRLAQRRLARAHRRSEALLYNALPPSVARQLRDAPDRRPVRLAPSATVLFADIVGFSGLARSLSPPQLLTLLNTLFTAFDSLAERHGLEKIKTVGDAYLAVSGLAPREPRAAARAACMALAQQRLADAVGRRLQLGLKLRIGLHTGPVVAGVLGSKRYAFDVWGDVVNIASRLQAAAPAGQILVSDVTRRDCGAELRFGPSRELALRGCGSLQASLLRGLSRSLPAQPRGDQGSGCLR